MLRGKISIFLIAFSMGLLLAGPLDASTEPVNPRNYARLLEWIEMPDREEPLHVFGGIQKGLVPGLNTENLAFINANDQLMTQIQSRLESDKIHWQLHAAAKQMWVVPESRKEYARLFEGYCRDAIDFLLARTQMPNPYHGIRTLQGPLPEIGASTEGGIQVYLVHNVMDEYIEEYHFYRSKSDPTQIKIQLSHRSPHSKVGAYNSELTVHPDQTMAFAHDRFTLWQNSAAEPLNVLMVPIEETLHILLRAATETGIRASLAGLRPASEKVLQQTVTEWMAVEEAVVGGMVWRIMPELLSRLVDARASRQMADTLAARRRHDQYRLLDQGIDMVAKMGLTAAISMYQTDPQQFKSLLTRPTATRANALQK